MTTGVAIMTAIMFFLMGLSFGFVLWGSYDVRLDFIAGGEQ